MLIPAELPDHTSLLRFLTESNHTPGSNIKGYFKLHDEHDDAYLLSDPTQPGIAANTSRDAVLFFLLAHDQDCQRLRMDADGWQYWSLDLDGLSRPHRDYEQVLKTMRIVKMIEVSSFENAKRGRRR